ncbi:Vitamin B12 import ATP-binding protein BtuD [bioreactor metagenome]|uniref:Vitamin B12 import ATP-binding protein BtuD n=1 Tax=bioreactor metagenome TaxID=1076179 RepID=A0A644ZAZ1_9ZZZZ|nr:ATP-binding cassette domain-containing protein [Oscillospiraceae bacterium]
MSEVLIKATNLSKEFIQTEKSSGIKGAFKNLFFAKKSIKKAVDHINFEIKKGEIVGYIGPNGAGKSTTIKIMCGILHPTDGEVTIYGLSPQKDRQKIVNRLGVVFGQRSQLYWDLRLGESFELLRRIYQVPKEQYESQLSELDRILGINEFINTPVRQLSLGQRMRGDLAASMLHNPEILFLDEPTIGLDVEVKYSIRQFIKEINEKYQTTIILTTHDLDDIQALCERVIIINHGQIISDCPLNDLFEKTAKYRQLIVELDGDETEICHPKAEFVKNEGRRIYLRFHKGEISASQLISDISAKYPVKDLSIEETEIDEIIRQIYNDAK